MGVDVSLGKPLQDAHRLSELTQATLVLGMALDDIAAQHTGGPPAELNTSLGLDTIADGDDCVESAALIDEPAATAMVDYAMEQGINYYDTAWGYHGGHSEEVLGRALAKFLRESFYLATKFPGYANGNFGKVEAIFEKQLEKCGVDYFDF